MKKNNFAIWLTPCIKDKDKLKKIILFLSQKFNSFIFEPHLTIYAGTKYNPKYLIKNIKKLKTINIQLRTKKLSSENNFFKSLFISININKDLNKLLMKLRKNLNLKIYINDPHISLMYKQLKKNEIQYIKKILKGSIPKNIKFCQLKVVIPRNNNWKDIKTWVLY